tara:strand:+ start:232 stop:912 length:681 start_codon:yes stop_codon:yes gene_type:complete
MTKVYLASPMNQLQASLVEGMDVLLSFGCYKRFLDSYVPSFNSLLIDSGAYSAFNSGKKIDVIEYVDWVQSFPKYDAFAGLDDIGGDWRKSLRNYNYGGFPTFHDTDPPELLDELVSIAEERGNWLGLGLKPPRSGKGEFLRRTLERIPKHIHVHGFALREYRRQFVFDSVDATSWFWDSFAVKKRYPWLTPAECIDIIVKREKREVLCRKEDAKQIELFTESQSE